MSTQTVGYGLRGRAARRRTRCVVMEACERLRDSSAPMKAIAQELEFSDEFHFSKRFKDVMGMSPGEFRKRWQAPGARRTRRARQAPGFLLTGGPTTVFPLARPMAQHQG
jgi:methylphosphotriester-DNA--protein-cysteine methyltransferase